ncbi:MAG TPA: hypothetical protein VNE61_14085 [Ktedonobacteraceae bacterium]|nr:hypothetical protein [Ktedonobacteraceae bacterium]
MNDEEKKRAASVVTARIGNATIDVSDEQFGNGYTVGYLRYLLDDAGRTLAEDEIYEFIMGHLLNARETDRWNTGLVTGWIAAMHNKA